MSLASSDPYDDISADVFGPPQQELHAFSVAPTIFGGQGRAAENSTLFSAV
jgi:hypothetical protein